MRERPIRMRDPSTPESWTANPWVWVVSFERVEVPRG